uniref:metallophosphoesterase n=10 Tax=Bacteria TaxID=2 RepID=UPI0037048797
MAEFVAVGDAHFTDSSGSGGLSKYVQNPDKMVADEIRRGPVKYARDNGISNILLLGDQYDGPRASYSGQRELADVVRENPDLRWHAILGNHEMYSEVPENGHALELFDLFGLQNLTIYTHPTDVKIDRAPVRFLPYPHLDFSDRALNIFHNEVYGSKSDSGRTVKKEGMNRSKAVAVGGHLHTGHKVRNTYFPGTLYQNNFGEQLPKYFAHIQFNSVADHEIEFINHDPVYKLHTVVLSSRADLENIPRGKKNLVKLVIQDGADVNASDYSAFSNIVLIKNFRSKEDLRAVLT